MEAVSVKALAERYGVTPVTLHQFGKRHADEIEQVRNAILAGLDNMTVGLWIADKANRIAEYQEDIERINDVLDKGLTNDGTSFLKIKHGAMKAVAEELAQLPTRSAPVDAGDSTVVAYTITKPQDLP